MKTISSSVDDRPRGRPRRSALLSRRAFGRTAVGLAAATATACNTQDPSRVRVASLAELEGGDPVEFELPGTGNCFAVKLEGPAVDGSGPDGSIVAFSSLCPHMGYPIAPAQGVDAQKGHFGPCPYHHSVFDIRNGGRMVHGCSSANLSRVELEIEEDVVYALAPATLAYGQPLTKATARTTPEDVEDLEGQS